jgi:hypothetical protein
MELFVTVAVIVAMLVFGVLVMHLLNSQHSDGVSGFHYGRSGMPVTGPAPPAERKGRGRLRPRRRTRKAAG